MKPLENCQCFEDQAPDHEALPQCPWLGLKQYWEWRERRGPLSGLPLAQMKQALSVPFLACTAAVLEF